MKFLVKHSKAPGRVFLSDSHIGLTNDPVTTAKLEALEYYFEPFINHGYGKVPSFGPSPKVSIHGDVCLIEPS